MSALRAGHHDIVQPGRGLARAGSHRLAQAAPGPVADHGPADLAGHGEPDAAATVVVAGPAHACRTKPSRRRQAPRAAARNSGRRCSRTIWSRQRARQRGPDQRSGGQALAAARPAGGDHLAAADRRHARAEPMPPLAHEPARLIGTLHGSNLDWESGKLAAIYGRPPPMSNRAAGRGHRLVTQRLNRRQQPARGLGSRARPALHSRPLCAVAPLLLACHGPARGAALWAAGAAGEPLGRHDAGRDASRSTTPTWAELLAGCVRSGGPDGINRFAYRPWHAGRRAAARRLSDASWRHARVGGSTRAEQKAFWINLYNALDRARWCWTTIRSQLDPRHRARGPGRSPMAARGRPS